LSSSQTTVGREHDRQRRGDYEPPFRAVPEVGLARSCHRKAASGEGGEVGATASKSRSQKAGLPSFGVGKAACFFFFFFCDRPSPKDSVESPSRRERRKIEPCRTIHKAEAAAEYLVVSQTRTKGRLRPRSADRSNIDAPSIRRIRHSSTGLRQI